jgi:hypothetical protein
LPDLPWLPLDAPVNRRSLVYLVLAATLGACATGGGPPRATGGGSPRAAGARPQLLVVARACDEPGVGQSCAGGEDLGRLQADLQRGVALRRREVSAGPAEASPDVGAAVVRALREAQTLYVGMKVGRARELLEGALARVRQTNAAGVDPADLARIHLYLGALAQAQNDRADAQQHFDAAVGFEADLTPDPDTFSPLVRRAVAEARQRRRTTEVAVRSVPAGATVWWDGRQQAHATPIELSDQALGEHYLRLVHPLHHPWGDRIVISTTAELETTLRPLPEPQVLAAALARPALRDEAARMLGVGHVLWLSPRERSVALELSSGRRDAARLTLSLPRDADRAAVRRAADRVIEAVSGAAPAERDDERVAAPGFWRRTWWIWAGAAVVGVAVAIAVPLAMQDDPSGRDAVMPLP